VDKMTIVLVKHLVRELLLFA